MCVRCRGLGGKVVIAMQLNLNGSYLNFEVFHSS